MRILIVGAGIAGMALAKALEQKGLEAQLIERQREPQTIGAGLFLPGNAVRAIKQLGLLEQAAATAAPIKRQIILDAGGKLLNAVDTQDFWHECGPCLSLPRRELQDILRASLKRSPVSFCRSVASLAPSRDGCSVTFDDGSFAEYDLVVGCDGIHSQIRELVTPGAAARDVGTACWRFITRNTAGIDCWTVMLGKSRALLAIPVSQTELYVYADIAATSADGLSSQSPLRSLFESFTSPLFPLVDNLPSDADIHFGKIEEVRLGNWTSGRIVLLGDAAHGCSPAMAEGAGMAMEDALVLAEELSLARGATIPEALRAYEERRRPRVEWVQRQCRARDKMRSLPALPRAAVLRLFGTKLYRRAYSPLLAPI